MRLFIGRAVGHQNLGDFYRGRIHEDPLCQLVHWNVTLRKGMSNRQNWINLIWNHWITWDVSSCVEIFHTTSPWPLDLVPRNLAVPCNSCLIPRNTNSLDLLVLLLNLFSICLRVGVQPWLAILQGLGMVERPCFQGGICMWNRWILFIYSGESQENPRSRSSNLNMYPPTPLPMCPTYSSSETFCFDPTKSYNTGLKKRFTLSSNVQNLLLLFGVHLLAQTLVVPGAFGSRSHRMDVAIEGIPQVLTGIMDDQIFMYK